MDYNEQYKNISEYLLKTDLEWVIEQVDEEIRSGIIVEEKISSLTEIRRDVNEKRKFKKGLQASFVKRVEYTDKEKLILLLEALKRSLVDPPAMEESVVSLVLDEEISSIKFQGEDEGTTYTIVENNLRGQDVLQERIHKINGLLEKVRDSHD